MASKLKLTELLYPTSTTPAITINSDDSVTIPTQSTTNLAYTGTLTGGTGVINIGSGQVYKDASGNVGIGTASPATTLQVTGDITQTWAASMDRFVGSKFSTSYELGLHFIESSRETRIVSKAADSTGLISFYTGVTPTEKMRISAAGNVGIGTISPANKVDVVTNADAKLIIRARNESSGSSASAAISLNAFGNTWGIECGSAAKNSNALTFQLDYNGANSEKMRLNTDGNLLVGTQTDSGARIRVNFSGVSTGVRIGTTATSGTAIQFVYEPATQVGTITTTTTATAYNTSSDYRLKENVAAMTGALQTVTQLKPCTYTWKANGSAGQGFIAHELQAVVPDCVTGAKDAIDAEGKPQYQGVDTSFLVATVVAALQELKAEFDAYKLSHP